MLVGDHVNRFIVSVSTLQELQHIHWSSTNRENLIDWCPTFGWDSLWNMLIGLRPKFLRARLKVTARTLVDRSVKMMDSSSPVTSLIIW